MKKRIKIGVFTSGFVPVNKESTKGTEVFTYDLCDGLTKAGAEVHLLVLMIQAEILSVLSQL